VKIELSQLFLRVTIVDLLDAQGVLLWIDLPLRQNKTAPPTYNNINPALEREAHVRTPIIEGKDAAAVEHDKDRTMAAMDNESALRLQHLKAACEYEFPARHVHQRSSRGRVSARCRFLK
jgi:hypothetical protein